MKRSEVLTKYYDKIVEAMVEDYQYVLQADGKIQYKIYVWEDGEIEDLCGVQGDNSWLQARDCEPRKLYFVCTVSEDPSFNLWDVAGEVPPDDEDESEQKREEIIDWLVDEYRVHVLEALYIIIEDAEREERMEQ